MEPDLNMTAEEEANVAVVKKLNQYVNKEEYDKMDALFTDNYQDHNPGWDIRSVDDLKEVIANGHKNFDVHNEIQRMIPSENMVFSEIVNIGTHQKEVFGCPPTGKETRMTTYEIYRLENNKIAERWVISNIIGLMKQVGAELPVDL